MKGFNTKAVHVQFNQQDPYGSLNFPVYDTAAFEFENSEEMECVFSGKKPT